MQTRRGKGVIGSLGSAPGPGNLLDIMGPIPEIEYKLIYGERTVRSVANATQQDAEELLQLAPEIPLRTDVELYSLEEANAVLRRMKRSEIRGAAVLQGGADFSQ